MIRVHPCSSVASSFSSRTQTEPIDKDVRRSSRHEEDRLGHIDWTQHLRSRMNPSRWSGSNGSHTAAALVTSSGCSRKAPALLTTTSAGRDPDDRRALSCQHLRCGHPDAA
jgi:hypothetical protein